MRFSGFLAALFSLFRLWRDAADEVNRRRPPRKHFSVEPLEDRTMLAIDIVIDYSLDTNGFFTNNDPGRLALESAAAEIAGRLGDTLDAIIPDDNVAPSISCAPGFNRWQAEFEHPATGQSHAVPGLQVPADTLIVYAGARDLAGNSLGESGPGGFLSCGTPSWNTLVETRGEGTSSQVNGNNATEFSTYGGTIVFDTLTPQQQVRNWHMDLAAPPVAGSDDLYSVALHEIAHLFGFGTAASYNNLIAAPQPEFTGPNAIAEYDQGGNVPLDVASNGAHWAEGTTDGGVEASLDPSLAVGERKPFTELDFNVLFDIGWDELAVPEVSLSVDQTSVMEGGSAIVTATLSAPTNRPVTVNLEFAGDAERGVDYTATATQIVIPANQTTGSTTINTTSGDATEGAEIANINVLGVVNARENGVQQVNIAITDVSQSAGILAFSMDSYAVSEIGGQATITVTRTGGSNGAVMVTYTTSDNSATQPDDYNSTSNTVSFADGDADSKTFTVIINDDTLIEGNETINLSLSNPTGGATLGAQNTALLTITDDDQASDYGDAPAPYPTTGLAAARHALSNTNVRLGGSVEADPDGQPDSNALGDDTGDSTDDEDGVLFVSPLVANRFARIEVTASTAGKLNAWIDYNDNGSWAEGNEQIFTDRDLVAGVNTLYFVVPPNVQTHETYARFRFSTSAGLSHSGPAADGEVEDYRVSIDTAPELSPITDANVSAASQQYQIDLSSSVVELDGDSIDFEAYFVTDEVLAELAYSLDQQLGLEPSSPGSFFQNAYGQNEKWLLGGDRATWFIVLPDGSLIRWDNTPNSTTGELIAKLDASYWSNIESLYNAADPLTVEEKARLFDQKYGLTSNGDYFLNYGRRNEKWIQAEDASWYFIDPDGGFYKWDGSVDLATSHRVATFDSSYWDDPSLLYNPSTSSVTLALDVMASSINQEHNFSQHSSGFFQNFYGQNEKWLIGGPSGTTWYFILENGQLFKWDGTPNSLSGTLIATLNELYHADPSLIFDPATTTIDPVLAFQLDETHKLFIHAANGYFQGVFGQDEKWMQGGENGTTWYFILPSGELFQWDGTSGSLTGTLIATLDPIYHTNPDYLHEATDPATIRSLDQQHNLELAQDDYYLDAFGQNEKWMLGGPNGSTWFYLLPNGQLFQWDNTPGTLQGTLIATISPAFYEDPSKLHDSEEPPQSNDEVSLVTEYNLAIAHETHYFNVYGQNEKWLLGGPDLQTWFILLGNGEVRQWDGTPNSVTGTLVGTVDTSYYNDPSLLFSTESEPTDSTLSDSTLSLTGSTLTFGFDSQLNASLPVLIVASDGRSFAYRRFNVNVS